MSSTTSKRLYPRQLRRLQVRFWRAGEDRPRQGFTKNVSLTGAFVATPDPAGRGDRLRLELSDGARSAMLYAVVVHSHRVPPELRRFADSAMGLRFLGLDEVVGPFLDEEALRPRGEGEIGSGRFVGGTGAVPVPERAGEVGGEGGGARSGGGGEAGPPGGGSPPAPPSPAAEERPPAAAAAASYTLAFATGEDFVATYRRDLTNGGLFVTTERPAPLNERVSVELRLPGEAAPSLRLEGRVVQVVEPRPLASGRTVGGMGLELLDADAALRRLAPYLARYEG